MTQPGEESWILDVEPPPPPSPEHSTPLRRRKGSRADLRVDLPDMEGSTTTNDTESPRRHSKSPKKVRFDERHRGSKQNVLAQSIEVTYQLIHALLLKPIKDILGVLFVYLLSFIMAIAVVYYLFHSVRIFLPGIVKLPMISRGFYSVVRWPSVIPQLPAALICATTGRLCPPNQHLLNVTYTAKEEIRQASKVLNTLDRFEPSKSNLMAQSV
jgi:hypothetical protein